MLTMAIPDVEIGSSLFTVRFNVFLGGTDICDSRAGEIEKMRG